MREKRKLFAVKTTVANEAEILKQELSESTGVRALSWTQFFALLIKNKEKLFYDLTKTKFNDEQRTN